MFDVALVPIAFIVVPLVVAYLVTRTISNNRTRRNIVEIGATPELVRALYEAPRPDTDGALKWGLVLIFVGLALVLIQLFRLDDRDPVTYGLLAIFAGVGLMSYYGAASRRVRRGGRSGAVEGRGPARAQS
jgi:hypothetical protein